MKLRFLANPLLAAVLLCLIACSNTNLNNAPTGTGLLYLAAQSTQSIQAYSMSLASGSLGMIGNMVPTGTMPTAMAVTPAVTALFVSNTGANSITGYTIDSDGSLTEVATRIVGKLPKGVAVDASGQFLFVANQASSSISVFSINGANLTPVKGSPFTTIAPGTVTPTGPVAVAVPPAGNYLYVANQFTNNVSAFSFNSDGALSIVPGSPYATGLNPSGLAISPAGTFLLVANSGSGNVSSFAICAIASATCLTPNGMLTPAANSPFSAGISPVAIAFDPGFNFVYVVDQQSNEVFQYSFGVNNGSMTALSPAAIATGTTPVSIAIRAGATGADIGSSLVDLTDYVYVANIGGSSMSGFTLTTSSGLLTVLGAAVTTNGNPSAVVAK